MAFELTACLRYLVSAQKCAGNIVAGHVNLSDFMLIFFS
nr:MAG TPA: hypothetical protein [Inoviridae sp.]